ncbi:MAG TPA: helix-turn-helix transcriptional regulator [Catalimonadaceae bacterium]|nr:helix-turn-helix transcriptional regulator [Catalimonadaceae bacterium]
MKSSIALARQSIGISQIEMARLLGISRSLYSMIEMGTRNIPVESLLQMNALMHLIEQNGTVLPIPEPTDDEKKQIDQKLLNDYQYELNQLDKQVDKAKKKREKQARKAQVLQNMDPATIENPKRTRLWKELHEIGIPEDPKPAEHWQEQRKRQLQRAGLVYIIEQLGQDLGS